MEDINENLGTPGVDDPGFERTVISQDLEAEIEFGDEIRCMIYGQSGAGKTELLSTLSADPRTSPVLWIDLEGGLRGVKDIVKRCRTIDELGTPEKGKMDVITIREWPQMQKIYDFLFKKTYVDKKLMYKSVVIDSLTEINQICLTNALGTSGTLKIDAKKAQFAEYMKVNTNMKDMIRAFRDISGLHVFYSALPQFKAENPKDENSRVWIKPDLIGKLADQAVALVDYVGLLKIGPGGKRVIQFQQDALSFAKERSPKGQLINKIEASNSEDYITMTRVLNAMLKEKK